MQARLYNYKTYIIRFIQGADTPAVLLLTVWLCISCTSLPHHVDTGPVVSHDRTYYGTMRQRAIGPLLEHQETEDGKIFDAVRPFYSSVRDTQTNTSLIDILWPLCTMKASSQEKSGRFLTAIWRNYVQTNGAVNSRFWVFPFLFTGSNSEGGRYFALFPLWGTIDKILGKEHIQFFLFPLYMKMQDKQCTEHNILWPVVAWTDSSDTNRYMFRVFPFYGESSRAGQKNTFIMWPFWTSTRSQPPSPVTGSGFIIFPLFGRFHSQNQDVWWILPPFFKIGHGKVGTEVHAPWPFVQWKEGKTSRLYIWPLWGKNVEGNNRFFFWLWPAGWISKSCYDNTEIRRYYFLPFIYYEVFLKKIKASKLPPRDKQSESIQNKTQDTVTATSHPEVISNEVNTSQVMERYFKLWPLYSYRRAGDITQTRLLSLWPAKYTPAVERNLSPIWTLFSIERSAEGGETELLWGLFRYKWQKDGSTQTSLFPLFNVYSGAGGTTKGWNVLGGIAGYKREKLQKTYRLLYFIRWRTGEKHYDN